MCNPYQITEICHIRGHGCNLCNGRSHCEDGDTVCPEGHRVGSTYIGLVCRIVPETGTCTICQSVVKNGDPCPYGHIRGQGYLWQLAQ